VPAAQQEQEQEQSMRRALTFTAAGLVVVLLLGLVAGGWYYSDQLLPAPPPYEAVLEVAVLASDEAAGTIELAATDGDLVDLATVGLVTADGLVVLDGAVDPGPSSTVRRGELVDGTWPAAGELVGSAVDTFAGDPERTLGLPYTEVAVPSPDGPLPAWRVVPDDAAGDPADGPVDLPWVVLVHGRGGGLSEGNRALAVANRLGLPTFTISVRNDPDAPADPDGFGRYGDAEWEDLQAAIDHLRTEEQAQRFVLVGYSQGGSIVLGFLRRSPDAATVDAAVLVSPLVSLHATLVLQAQQRDIPDPVIPPLLWATRWITNLRAGLEFSQVEHLERIGELPDDLPLLVTHGDADTTVPVGPTRELAAALPEQVTYEEYAGSEHVREWNTDRERFEADLEALLRTHVPTPVG
jgi:uncharacterized protein